MSAIALKRQRYGSSELIIVIDRLSASPESIERPTIDLH